jgi:hypothetical protein
MNRRKIALFFIIAAVSALVAMPAAAYSHFDNCNGHWTRWQNPYRTLNVSTYEGQFTSAEWQNSLEAARQAWNYAPGSSFRFWYQWTPNQLSGYSGDGSDDIAILTNWPHQQEVKAYTAHKRSDCDDWNPFDVQHYTEVDVQLKSETRSFDKSTNPVPSTHMSNTTLVLLHELGHAMGLGHEDAYLATMNSHFGRIAGPVGNANEVQPYADDVRGARAAYGNTCCPVGDVASSVFRRAAAGIAEPIPVPASVNRNSSVSFQFTVMNRGTADQTFPVYFYLSPTRYVHPSSSFFLGSTTISLQQGRATTGSVTLQIPVNAPAGPQYLGWYVDPLNVIAESNADNNGVSLLTPTTINANAIPTACFTATPSSGNSPLYVTFNASCSSDADGGPLTYSWDLGDGMGASGQTVSNTYFGNQSYLVWLTVTDPHGAQSSTYRYVTVSCDGGRFCPDEPY